MSMSISSPPTRMLRLTTMPPRLMTATSVVPPPMSMMRLPVGLVYRQAGSDGRGHRLLDQARPAGAGIHGRVTGRRASSTSVTPDGMPSNIRGRGTIPIRS